jgi:AbrB family looped-hinge helix DNA binding protein
MSTITQLNSAGQLTIPVAVRKRLGLAGGGPVQITVQGSRLVIEAGAIVNTCG